jgi:hypothetical protein
VQWEHNKKFILHFRIGMVIASWVVAMKRILSGFLSAAAMCGCVREMEPDAGNPQQEFSSLTADEIKLLTDRQMSARLSSDEIDRAVADVVRLLGHSVASTRSTSARSVARIRPLAVNLPIAGSTRATHAPDTLFHAIDFADSLGYCIVAADRRLPDPIVCFVEYGSFPDHAPDAASGKRFENPGLALMMEAVGVYAARSLDRYGTWCDSVAAALLSRTGAESLDAIAVTRLLSGTRFVAERYTPTWYFNRRSGPLLPVEWSQGNPFNATVVDSTKWSTTPVGCVALATAQVMAYWKHPVDLHGVGGGSIDWDELRRWTGPQGNRKNGYGEWQGPMSDAPAETRKLIADLLWHIGREVKMNYGASNSTAYTYRAVGLLDSLGFSRGRTVGYSHKAVIGSLDAGWPVMIDGASHRSEYGTHANAHCWVIDGFMEERWWDAWLIDRHFYEQERFRWYLHNNFGWGGLDNGWYVAGVFDANNNPDLPSNAETTPPDSPSGSSPDSSSPTTRAEWLGEHYNYQFMQTLYVDIHR